MLLLRISSLIFFNSLWLESGFSAPRSNPIRRISFQNYRKDVEPFEHIPTEYLILAGNSTEKDLSEADVPGDNTAYKSQAIVFPDSKNDKKFEITLQTDDEPKCAEGSTFCEEIESYPYSRLKSALSTDNRHKELFGIDEGPIEHRIGDPEDNFICPSIDRIIFPKIAKNKYNKWKYIINQGEQDGYVQGVRIETCIKPNGPCNLLDSTPHGYVTSCKQKYIYRRLLSLSDVGRPLPDTFQMPSACCCSYKRDPGYLINFGKDDSSVRSEKQYV